MRLWRMQKGFICVHLCVSVVKTGLPLFALIRGSGCRAAKWLQARQGTSPCPTLR